MISRTCLYIAATRSGDLRIGVTKDLFKTALKSIALPHTPLTAIVHIEEFAGMRDAAARYVELKRMSQEQLARLVTETNPDREDLSGAFLPVAASPMSSLLWSLEWDDDDDGGGVFASLPTSPYGPIRTKDAPNFEAPPPLWDRERECAEIFGA